MFTLVSSVWLQLQGPEFTQSATTNTNVCFAPICLSLNHLYLQVWLSLQTESDGSMEFLPSEEPSAQSFLKININTQFLMTVKLAFLQSHNRKNIENKYYGNVIVYRNVIII